MTGTGSGNAPTLYTNGVDANINMAIMPKGTGGVGIGTTTVQTGYILTGNKAATARKPAAPMEL